MKVSSPTTIFQEEVIKCLALPPVVDISGLPVDKLEAGALKFLLSMGVAQTNWLNMSSCRFGPGSHDGRIECLQLIFDSIKESSSHLTTLNISQCDLGSLGLKEVAMILSQNSTLQTLDVSNNGVCLRSFSTIDCDLTLQESERRLNRNFPQNIKFERQWAPLARDISGVELLTEMIKHSSTIRHLNLSGPQQYIRADVAPMLASMLHATHMQNCCLESLNLCGNQLGSAGVQALAHGLANNRTLHILNLASNLILSRSPPSNGKPSKMKGKPDKRGLRSLVAAVHNHPCLKTIILSNNDIGGPAGVELLPLFTSKDSHLEMIDLSANNLRNNGPKKIVPVVQKVETPKGFSKTGKRLSIKQARMERRQTRIAMAAMPAPIVEEIKEDPSEWLKLVRLALSEPVLPNLQCLNLGSNSFGPNDGAELRVVRERAMQNRVECHRAGHFHVII